MTTARISGTRSLCGRGWSLVALALCAAAEAATLAVVFGPGQDTGDIRWPLVALPLVLAALPVLLPSRRARIGTAIVMACWCVVASASVGLFFVLSLLAMVVAAARSDA